MDQSSLNLPSESKNTGPVECLGKTFASEEARREHFLALLTEKLKDPEFRKIEGFPIGKDEDILALSDPPYYTACPNPWLADFVKCYGTPYDSKKTYHREPFAADVSEGKNHPIYNAHSYHTKVPHRAIMRYILHYTEPGDLVFDGFCGTGMTGVAAQLCGDRKEVQELGYRVLEDGTILNEEGKAFSKLGARRAVLNDLSPAATFIAANYNLPVDGEAFEEAATQLLKELRDEIGWMYETRHTDGTTRMIDYTVWSEVYTCPECGGELTFTDEALDEETKKVRDEFPCPHCTATLTKRRVERVFESVPDPMLGTIWKRVKFKPCLIQYRVGKTKCEKVPDADDLAVLKKIEAMSWPQTIPANEWPIKEMYHGSRIAPKGFTHTHHFFLDRAAIAIGKLWGLVMQKPEIRLRSMLLFFVEQAVLGLSRMNRYSPSHFSQVNRMLSGVYYIAAQHSECSPWYNLDGKLSRITKAFLKHWGCLGNVAVSTDSADSPAVPVESLDYVFTDPPFGANIPYADLNLVIESWHKVKTRTTTEAIIDKPKGKDLPEYQQLMLQCFQRYYAALKPGRWITVEFSNSHAAVWNAIQSTLEQAGFVVANVAALDKQQHTFRAVTSPTAWTEDLIISAYKPNDGLEARFSKSSHTVQGVWEFLTTHLKNLPITKAKGGALEFITEREPRNLYARLVIFYLVKGLPIPLSASEFQAEIPDKFPQRDGMVFLPQQVAEYDKMRLKVERIGQMVIFVEDEKSAADWLYSYLKDRPSTYQEFSQEFMKQLNASWKKWEKKPDLNGLLQLHFLRYDGTLEVPSQIHAYLSTQFKDLRNLSKDHPQLRAKAKDRWYVPDPKNLIQVEELRNKRLLEEFWNYLPDGYRPAVLSASQGESLPGLAQPRPKIPRSKKLKEVRTEAVRVGFKHCYQAKDYGTILAVAEMLPESILNEDEQLQMLYDNAAMRSGES